MQLTKTKWHILHIFSAALNIIVAYFVTNVIDNPDLYLNYSMFLVPLAVLLPILSNSWYTQTIAVLSSMICGAIVLQNSSPFSYLQWSYYPIGSLLLGLGMYIKRYSRFATFSTNIKLTTILAQIFLIISSFFTMQSGALSRNAVAFIYLPILNVMCNILLTYTYLQYLNFVGVERDASTVAMFRVDNTSSKIVDTNLEARQILDKVKSDTIIDSKDRSVLNIGDRIMQKTEHKLGDNDTLIQLADTTELHRRIDQLKMVGYLTRHDMMQHVSIARSAAQYIELDGYSEDAFSLIREELEKALELLYSIAEWTRLVEGRKDKIEIQILDVNDIIENITFDGIQVIVKGDLGVVEGNKGLISAVFRNLLDNSFKYCPFNHPTVVIYREDDTIYLRDNAGGFGCVDGAYDETYAKKLFHPRQRGNTKVEGNGLGLAIINTTIELHDWKLSYDSFCGNGTLWKINTKTW